MFFTIDKNGKKRYNIDKIKQCFSAQQNTAKNAIRAVSDPAFLGESSFPHGAKGREAKRWLDGVCGRDSVCFAT